MRAYDGIIGHPSGSNCYRWDNWDLYTEERFPHFPSFDSVCDGFPQGCTYGDHFESVADPGPTDDETYTVEDVMITPTDIIDVYSSEGETSLGKYMTMDDLVLFGPSKYPYHDWYVWQRVTPNNYTYSGDLIDEDPIADFTMADEANHLGFLTFPTGDA